MDDNFFVVTWPEMDDNLFVVTWPEMDVFIVTWILGQIHHVLQNSQNKTGSTHQMHQWKMDDKRSKKQISVGFQFRS